MKTAKKRLALAIAACFSLAACVSGGAESGIPTKRKSFTDIAAMEIYLSSFDENSVDAPIPVKLTADLNDTLDDILFSFYIARRFVDLDLSDCTGIEEVTVSKGNFEGIPGFYRATAGSEFIARLAVPGSASSIGRSAFTDCFYLAGIDMGGVAAIERNAFSACWGLSEITIPASVASIGDGAFYGCARIASVTFEGDIGPDGLHANAFSGMGDLRDKYFAPGGGRGTYVTENPGASAAWAKTD